MGSCYCKQGPVILTPSEIGVFETKDKKEEEYKKEENIKLDLENLSNRNNIMKLKSKKSTLKKVRFSCDNLKENEIENNKNNGEEKIKRRAKQKAFQSVKALGELVQLNKQLKLKYLFNDKNDSINKDKISNLNFNSNNGSEISLINKDNNEIPKKKFQRRNIRGVTGIDKSFLSQKLF